MNLKRPFLILSFLTTCISVFSQDIDTISLECNEIRPLSEINSSSEADAYPWISDDGLRVYYTTSNEDDVDRLYMISRPSLSEEFSLPVSVVSFSEESSLLSQWLTQDELEIYFVVKKSSSYANRTIYYARRDGIGEEFSEAVEVNLIASEKLENISAPSLTQNLEELFIFQSREDTTAQIIIFDQTEELEYTIKDTLDIPDGYEANPAGISSDDLNLYIFLENNLGTSDLFVYSRDDINSEFNISRVDNSFTNDSTHKATQGAISNGSGELVYVVTHSNRWENNNLYINTCPQLISGTFSFLEEDQLIAYPNPTFNEVNLQEAGAWQLFDSLGNLTIEGTEKSFNLRDQPSGIYLLKSEDGRFVRITKL